MNWLIDEKGYKYIIQGRYLEKLYRPRLSMFKTRYRNPGRPWYSRNLYLNYLVQWLIVLSEIYPRWFSNNGKFKIGDLVIYNWKAKVQIYSVVIQKHQIEVVKEILFKSKSNLNLESGNGCAAFWVRKLWFWEVWIYKIKSK